MKKKHPNQRKSKTKTAKQNRLQVWLLKERLRTLLKDTP